MFHLGQQFVQHHHLPTVHHQVEVSCVWRPRLSAIKQIRMVAALSQLHEDVQQTHLVHFTSRVEDVNVLHQNLCVPDGEEDGYYSCAMTHVNTVVLLQGPNQDSPLSLHLAQTHIHLDLFFWKQGLFHISFNTSEQERTQNLGKKKKKKTGE